MGPAGAGVRLGDAGPRIDGRWNMSWRLDVVDWYSFACLTLAMRTVP